MLIEQGKRLLSVMGYAYSLMPMNFPDDESWINRYGIVSELGIDLLTPVATSAGRYRFMPGPEFSPRLYRGQNKFYPRCRPSIFRGMSDVDALYWVAKSIELSAVMDRHPATSDLMAYQIEGLDFALSIEAIAQHYQYPTQLLDFSRSRDVAMFFATCVSDQAGDAFSPLQSGVAVLYTVNLRELILQRGGQSSFLPLGLEPLPRPEAQRALALRLGRGENLNDMPWVQHQKLEITPTLSRHYFEMFDGGKKLFPDNPFDGHIAALRTNRTLPLQALEFGIEQGLLPAHPEGVTGARNALKAAGYTVEYRAIDIDESVMQAAADEWAVRKLDYFSRIRIRGVADHMVIE
ncbi:FRG domain-containing protein [Thiovibrio frasassiensis]|uniref:FRG domain-containing protein n=1 Tax=Thiovibrio frasassiensis TaxID=2984131 RepID=A0A9X4MFS5_9BACT|nr:FRG domain-containing protein [Thiovibrio frasassiensis]MDG4474733.1 FRG domain-containing protein [Thiovibrio frasassiensis]